MSSFALAGTCLYTEDALQVQLATCICSPLTPAAFRVPRTWTQAQMYTTLAATLHAVTASGVIQETKTVPSRGSVVTGGARVVTRGADIAENTFMPAAQDDINLSLIHISEPTRPY